jgi:hypothetical protein
MMYAPTAVKAMYEELPKRMVPGAVVAGENCHAIVNVNNKTNWNRPVLDEEAAFAKLKKTATRSVKYRDDVGSAPSIFGLAFV